MCSFPAHTLAIQVDLVIVTTVLQAGVGQYLPLSSGQLDTKCLSFRSFLVWFLCSSPFVPCRLPLTVVLQSRRSLPHAIRSLPILISISDHIAYKVFFGSAQRANPNWGMSHFSPSLRLPHQHAAWHAVDTNVNILTIFYYLRGSLLRQCIFSCGSCPVYTFLFVIYLKSSFWSAPSASPVYLLRSFLIPGTGSSK